MRKRGAAEEIPCERIAQWKLPAITYCTLYCQGRVDALMWHSKGNHTYEYCTTEVTGDNLSHALLSGDSGCVNVAESTCGLAVIGQRILRKKVNVHFFLHFFFTFMQNLFNVHLI